jgi:hypothetical protein
MTSRFDVIFQGHSLARAFISPSPGGLGARVGSVLPIERSGRWGDGTLEIAFRELESAFFASDTPELEVVNELLAGVGIEPWKCSVVREQPI